MVYTWASKGLAHHNFGIYVRTIKLLGAFGFVGGSEKEVSEQLAFIHVGGLNLL